MPGSASNLARQSAEQKWNVRSLKGFASQRRASDRGASRRRDPWSSRTRQRVARRGSRGHRVRGRRGRGLRARACHSHPSSSSSRRRARRLRSTAGSSDRCWPWVCLLRTRAVGRDDDNVARASHGSSVTVGHGLVSFRLFARRAHGRAGGSSPREQIRPAGRSR